MISVVMSVYNETLEEIKESTCSILNQSINDLELIIVDDNPSSIIIKNYLVSIKNKDNRIKIFFNSYNMGAITSRNKGMKKASGNYISIMDADDIAFNNKISLQLNFLNDNNLDIVCSNFTSFSSKGITKENCYINKTIVDQSKIMNIMRHENIAIGPTLFFKKNILENLKGYRDILVEDYDFSIRALINNYRFGYLSKDLLYKRERKNNLSNSNQLKEFVILLTVIKYVRKNHFNKVIPIQVVNFYINKISDYDIYKYNALMSKYLLFKKNKSLYLFFNMLFIAFSSKILFKKEIYSLYLFIKKKINLY